MNPNHYLAVAIRYLLDAPAAAGRRGRRSARRWCRSGLIDRVVAGLGRQAAARCRSASSGSSPGCSTARSASAARRARARASCAATARVWTTDKDGIDPGPAGRRDHRAHRQGSRRALPGADARSSARRTTRASTRRRRRRRRRALKKLSPGGGDGAATLAGEPITAQADARARQRRGDRRAEGRRPRTAGSRRGRRARRTSNQALVPTFHAPPRPFAPPPPPSVPAPRPRPSSSKTFVRVVAARAVAVGDAVGLGDLREARALLRPRDRGDARAPAGGARADSAVVHTATHRGCRTGTPDRFSTCLGARA